MTPAPLALYIHWPFCVAKCPYCDFNSHVADAIDQPRWAGALLSELRHAAQGLTDRRLGSVFFGGGTPSLMAPQTVAALLADIDRLWGADRTREITLEANPGSVDAARFADFAAAGINRVSIGVQSFDDDVLRFLGRRHDAAQARAAVTLAARLFPRFSFDLIYARPDQSLPAWRAELDQALTLAGDHLSLYQLTIEPGTRFHTLWRRGALVLPEEDAGARMFSETREILAAAGLPAYEISNHARPGQESRHNLTYWHYDDYIGIGPGAHGRVSSDAGIRATRRQRAPETWLDAVARQGHGLAETTPIDPPARLAEMVMMGLRLSAPLREARLIARTGYRFATAFDTARLHALIDAGDLVLGPDGLAATEQGHRRLDAVLAYLLG